MVVVVCLDDNRGMMFNDRRQSRDRVVISNLISTAAGKPIYIKEYSKMLFTGDIEYSKLVLCENPSMNCAEGDIYFNETDAMDGIEVNIEKVIVYNWNRTYPSDKKFELNLGDYTLVSTEEFEGSSHDKITKEIYEK